MRHTNLKKQQHSRRFIIILHEITEAFVEDDLLVPLWNGRFVFLKVEGLSYDGQDVLDVLLFIEG